MSSNQTLEKSWIPNIVPYSMPSAGDLPRNTAQWEVQTHRAVLLIHDMQNYFLERFPTDGPPRAALVSNVVRLRRACVALGMPVCYTAQPGSMTQEQRGLLNDFWGPGMTVDRMHKAVVDPLSPSPEDWIVTKWRYSAFHRTPLLARMRGSGRDQLVICGVYAHLGVLMTACDAFSHDIQPFLVADAVADFSPEHHRMALEYAADRCAVVTTAASLLADLPATHISATGQP